jgi:hypothetical protein
MLGQLGQCINALCVVQLFDIGQAYVNALNHVSVGTASLQLMHHIWDKAYYRPC